MTLSQRPSRIRTILGTLFVLVAAILVLPFTGAIDVGATSPHLPGLEWFLETTRERSIASRSEAISVPDDLESPERIARGLVAYQEMCVGCHGAPGRAPGWLHRGLNPEPPELSEHSEERRAAADFWIVRNGIRMTAMPALAPTHDDAEIWDLVAFVQQLPKMSASSYASALEKARAEVGSHHHEGDDHGSDGALSNEVPDSGSPAETGHGDHGEHDHSGDDGDHHPADEGDPSG